MEKRLFQALHICKYYTQFFLLVILLLFAKDTDYLKGIYNIPADSLSRLTQSNIINAQDEACVEYSYLNWVQEESKAINCNDIKLNTNNDLISSTVKWFVLAGCPSVGR